MSKQLSSPATTPAQTPETPNVGAPEQDPMLAMSTSPGGGNQAAIDMMGAEGAGDDLLDEVLGSGQSAYIEELLWDVNDLYQVGAPAFSGQVDAELQGLAAHLDGASGLAGLLGERKADLAATIEEDEDGSLFWDDALEDAVNDLILRVQDAIVIMDAVVVLANADALTALAATVEAFSAGPLQMFSEMKLKAELGRDQMNRLTEMFAEHKEMLNKHLLAASVDTAMLLTGPLGKLGEAGKDLADAAIYGNAVWKAMSNPDDAWGAVKKVKTVTLASVKALADPELFAQCIAPIGMLLTACQTAMDLGLSIGEVAILEQLVDEAERVEADYGQHMRFYEGNTKMIEDAITAFSNMQNASENVGAAIADAQATVESVTKGWGGNLYDPGY